MKPFDLTPDTKVLLALTHTPMQPLDALCELIDNSIDSFNTALMQGNSVKRPLIIVELPRLSDLGSSKSCIRVRDNGSGLSADQAEKALKAGYSGNNPYDSLGLFGMGFNISTGKLGRITRFLTARKEDTEAIEVIVDLEKIGQSRNFFVPVNLIRKPDQFECGTIVEIRNWWQEGNANSGFIKKLIQYGMPKVRQEIGRRYSNILLENRIQIKINDEFCKPYEHCIWADSRYVERKGQPRIPAVIRFDEQTGSQKRCLICTALIDANSSKCSACGSLSLRTIEERIRGWVGIQRFDSPTDYGIDLIRNGRAIRIREQSAFFEFTDEFKNIIKDYPIDSNYGRIVGEVHLNHVPVDFLKQDFQRSSNEWVEAISFLRGDSSLQPTKAGADKNNSPIYRLYQGYRKVRKFGRVDLYMGVWDSSTGEARRISRDTEKEYYNKFQTKLPGYYDDTEWWKLVEQADKKPLEELVNCHECSAQNLKGHDTCVSCNAVLIGKECINNKCKVIIPKKAVSCPDCGKSQVIEILHPWTCKVCLKSNKAEMVDCSECSSPQGTLNPLSRESLIKESYKNDDLSIPACTIILANGSNSDPTNVNVYCTKNHIIPNRNSKPIPLISIKTPETIEIFLDMFHPLFQSFQIRPEQLIAYEVALFIYDTKRSLSGPEYQGIHSLSTIAWHILQKRWNNSLEDGPERLRDDITKFFNNIREQLPLLLVNKYENIYDDLSDIQIGHISNKLIGSGLDIRSLHNMRATGQYLNFVDEKTIIEIFRQNLSDFMDGKYWSIPWLTSINLSDAILESANSHTRSQYLNCLEDLEQYLRYQKSHPIIVKRTRDSLKLLLEHLS